jgi:hypothetical protein
MEVSMRQNMMLLLVAAVLLVLVVTGCGSGVLGPNADQGTFTSYVQEFEQAAKDNGLDLKGVSYEIPITFDDLNKPMAGRCDLGLLGIAGPKILIDRSTWGWSPETQKKLIIFHELGHCVLHRAHNDGTMEMEGANPPVWPTSIMNADILNEKLYEQQKNEYDHELFSIEGGLSEWGNSQ